ncbi:hypothetical protein WJX81_006508 [Elliptochloris bilobata]|uniref:Arp2/3 complex 41 kDa subunit n=1 Tax=Elliptochloris bilobata TaxID=381761 RepID=A0AAW1RT03_9CHLO
MAFASHKLAAVLSCHAWDSRCARLAICPNNHEVHIYDTPELEHGWVRAAVLAEHGQLVSGLDWHGERLVSCSHDRNAYVWTRGADGQWKPEMVITKLDLAALCVRWSPSSVAAVAWHPGGALLATASSDGRCRIFNARITGVDSALDGGHHPALAASRFGDLLSDIAPGCGWGLACAWSPSGDEVAMACHGAAVAFAGGLNGGPRELYAAAGASQRLRLPGRPARCLVYLSGNMVAAAGAGGDVLLLRRGEGGSWEPLHALHGQPERASAAVAPMRQVSAEFSAKLELFKVSAESKAAARRDGEKANAHSNAVVDLRPLPPGSGLRFSTAGWDGRVVLWDASAEGAAAPTERAEQGAMPCEADTIAAVR